MLSLKKITLTLTFAFFIIHVKAQTFNPLLAAMLQDTLNTYVSQIPNIKGMSASVFIPGQGVWTGVTGNSYAGKPISSNMRFGIASNTKLFVAVMMLKLAESKVFGLDDSIKKWVAIANPNINPAITIRQLLNHTSGVSDPFSVSPWFDTIKLNPTRVFTPEEVLRWIGSPIFPVGTGWQYSNTNYIIAGMVAQSASGISLAKLIRDSILTPLNMDSTFIDFEEPTNGTLAHRWWNTIDFHDTSRVGLNSSLGYAGNIFSTSSEMVQWYDALFSGKVLREKSMLELTNFVYTVAAIHFIVWLHLTIVNRILQMLSMQFTVD
jgi:D-alanyl-D-alanine carboxypeptidase